MRNKIILGCMLLALTTCAFGEEVKKEAATSDVQLTKQEIKSYDVIRKRWKEFTIGLPTNLSESNLSAEEIQKIVKATEELADFRYAKMDLTENRESVFVIYKNMDNGVHIQRSYDWLLRIARAYEMPGTKYYKDPEVKKNILDGMEWLYINAYHEGLPEKGNWWQWELGIPKLMNNLIAVMYDEMATEDVVKYLKASQYFQPYAKYSGASPSAVYSSSPDKRVSTGGNRLDTAMISFIRGVLMKDEEQVLDAVNAVGDVGEYVTSGDGFYRDGSFVQHGNVAYNGTYAPVLFNGLGAILWLANGTEFELTDKRIENVYESILNSYNYLMINGGVNDSVNGRSISRNNSSDIERGKGIIESFALLIEGAPAKYKEGLKRLTKTVVLENNYYNLVDRLSNPVVREIIRNTVEDEKIEPITTQGTKIFGAMDRSVYKNSKNGKVVLSMHSERIANYETMNGENIQGWYTGDGMMYIYGNDSSGFVEYWPTIDMYHLPGVTNSLAHRRNGSGERRMRAFITPTAFAGGTQGASQAFLGMDMLSWNKRTEVKKSYLMTDDVVLVVASNLKSSDGIVHTTIDNRILREGKILVDGKPVTEELVIAEPKGVVVNFEGNYEGENIGYKVIDGPELVIKTTENKGSWEKIGGKDKKELTNKYFTMYLNHGKNPCRGKFAYVVMPMLSKEEVANFDTSRFEIVKADNDAHIIKDREKGITAINFWRDEIQKFEGIRTYSTLSVIMEDRGEEKLLYLSDPAQLQEYTSNIEVDGKYELVESTDPSIKVVAKGKTTKIEIDLRNNGSTHKVVLRKI